MELIVVIIIMAILSQIGMVSFNRYIPRTRALAAETALLDSINALSNNLNNLNGGPLGHINAISNTDSSVTSPFTNGEGIGDHLL